jgi:RDD family
VTTVQAQDHHVQIPDWARSKRRAAPEAALGSRIWALLLTLVLIIGTLGVGWLCWSLVEWKHGRTASFRLTHLRVVRRSDGSPVGLGRSLVRNLVCCTVLIVPTILACLVIGLAFVMGASPPSGLLSSPRAAPWDLLTDTKVVSESLKPARPILLPLRTDAPDKTPVSFN